MVSKELLAEFRRRYPCGDPRPLGLGRRPAVLVVDFIEGFTHRESPLGGDWDREVAATSRLVEAGRRAGAPVIFTTVELQAADLETSLLCLKTPRINVLLAGSRWTAVDPRLNPRDEDLVIAKQHGSAFFGTSLAARLGAMNIDTLLVAGCVTSGCVRASVVDAVQSGFRTAVVREAAGDRSVLAHEANLMDIEQRYGDVIDLDEALRYLASGSAES